MTAYLRKADGKPIMKKLRTGLFYLLLFLAIVPLPTHARDICPPRSEHYIPINERLSRTIMFRLCREGQKPAYILGTFHSDSPDITPIFRDAQRVLNQTDQLALELVMDDSIRAQARAHLLLPSDHPGLKSMLGADLFSRAVTAIGPLLRADADALNRFKPWALAILIQYPKPEADGIVLDERLQQAARRRGVEVIALETLQEQFSVFDSMSESDQIDFLRSSIADVDELEAMQEELKHHYIRRDLPAIKTMSDRLFADMADDYPALAAYLEAQILDARNALMAERLLPLLSRPTLAAVGALHLPGNTGVLALLEAEGYAIEPVE